MSWFFIALVGPLLYAITNYIDKFLLEKYFKDSNIGAVLLISSLVSIFVLPFVYFIDNTVFAVSHLGILVLCTVGLLNVLVIWCYLIALKEEEASIVVVFYQLVPVFGAILSYFILGETLTHLQIIAMAIIIFGTTIISFEVDEENKFKLRHKTIIPMVIAGLCWALGSVLFKSVALEENLWRSVFWEHVMLTFSGVLIFIFIPSYRRNFLSTLRTNSKKVLSLNLLNEILYISGNIVVSFAYLLAPLGLVLLSESFQPIFVFLIGLFLTILFPKVIVEKIYTRHILQKIMAIIITGIGTYLLFL